MENHHHCEICGNMISPSKKVCGACFTTKSCLLPKKVQKHLDDGMSASALQDAIERFVDQTKVKNR